MRYRCVFLLLAHSMALALAFAAPSLKMVRVASPETLFALGDIHGDYHRAVKILQGAGLVDKTLRWSGRTSALVITGDVIDKGGDSLRSIDFLINLEKEAEQDGGKVVVTLGNHEQEFLSAPRSLARNGSAAFLAELERHGLDPVALAAGEGEYGTWLTNRPIAALVGSWFFSHAGNSRGMSTRSIEGHYERVVQGKHWTSSFLAASDSIVNARHWWIPKSPTSSPVSVIDHDLKELGACHIVFGHDPHAAPFPGDPKGARVPGNIVARYDGRLFMTDTGLSRAMHISRGSILRVQLRGVPRADAVYPNGSSVLLWDAAEDVLWSQISSCQPPVAFELWQYFLAGLGLMLALTAAWKVWR